YPSSTVWRMGSGGSDAGIQHLCDRTTRYRYLDAAVARVHLVLVEEEDDGVIGDREVLVVGGIQAVLHRLARRGAQMLLNDRQDRIQWFGTGPKQRVEGDRRLGRVVVGERLVPGQRVQATQVLGQLDDDRLRTRLGCPGGVGGAGGIKFL